MMIGNCGTCKFWLEAECHRYPPQLVVLSAKGAQTQAGPAWPPVREEQVCGEYLPLGRLRPGHPDDGGVAG